MDNRSSIIEQPLRISIREYGSRSHQRGGESHGMKPREYSVRVAEEEIEEHGPVVVHVQGGVAVTAYGKSRLFKQPGSGNAFR
jgi:hypothetical protein